MNQTLAGVIQINTAVTTPNGAGHVAGCIRQAGEVKLILVRHIWLNGGAKFVNKNFFIKPEEVMAYPVELVEAAEVMHGSGKVLR